jgi:uncharacterized protein YggE
MNASLPTLLALLLIALPLAAEDLPTIKVVGVAEERVPADQLRVACTIKTTGKQLAEVAAANRQRAAEITKILRDLGLGEAELTTGSASFGEDTKYVDGRHVRIGYEANTSITIATGKLKLYDPLWLKLSKFPEVSIDSAEFGLLNRAKVRATARTKALLAARTKAEEMADALDARIGAPLSIVESPQRLPFGANISANVSRNSIDSVLSNPDRSPPLEPGLVSVVEQVEATFELIE